MKNNKLLIWIVVIQFIVIGVLVYFLLNQPNNESSEVTRLQKEIKATEMLLSEKTNLINSKQKGIDSLQSIIDNEPKNDETTNTKYYEKLKFVNMFDVSDQQSYFDDRTGQTGPTTKN